MSTFQVGPLQTPPIQKIRTTARGLSRGTLRPKLPFWSLGLSPVVDMHSGFAYSNVDVLQNYVGVPNGLRFPTYFSLDVKVYRDFPIRIPFKERPTGKVRKIRIGVYSLDVTNRQNPHDIFSN